MSRSATPPVVRHEPVGRRGQALVLTALSLSMLLPSLSISIANVGLPSMAVALDATFPEVQWIVIAYLLAITTLIVGVGRLGDLIGRRRLLVLGIAVFTVATLLCGLAPNLPLLIAARALQGVGAACMMALAMASVGAVVPAHRTGSAMGLLGTMSAVGTALGPSLGGVLIDVFGWRAIFFAVVPVGLLVLALTLRLPADAAAGTSARRFDTLGTVLLAVTLGAYALAVTAGSFGLLSLGLLGVAGAGLALFVVTESKVSFPLLTLGMLRDPVLAVGLTTSTLVSAVMMTTLVVGPFHLGGALGLGTAAVGLVMSAGPAVSALTGVPAGRATDRFGSRTMVIVGLVGVIAAALTLSVMPVAAGVLGYLLPLVVCTASYATFQAANNTAVMKDVAAQQRGLVSGMLNLSRNLGLTTGASVMGAVFARAAGTRDLTASTPAEIARGTHWTFAVAALLVGAGLAPALLLRRPRTNPAV
ncbi:drug resistance transporter, EmrB/QacA subfamily [Nocardia amikacinitolerans]|uniref:Drug resistance transporter, EmrB/QacA subfamily n=1 Tax=Nocardia amikacinitolerans TaxID=756689 RepID=A0A285L690_9NOCA|nr:MFS transporter [Nocardia amikacinitolerans]SNY79136.1 drug resistance transporter, EmrB/QacA subfamily [Nocardia amikacinitolerans]